MTYGRPSSGSAVLPKSVFSCYMLTNDSTICDKAEVISNTIESFISFPSIGILVRFSPLISLVDDLAFYVYHRPSYDKGFQYVKKLCSEWTQNKWIPPFLDKLATWLNNVTTVINNTNIDGETVQQPNKFE